ncbi:MAG TPA: STAS domain-containing protein, partial [Euzebyales bacterium]|nr:STAS domain-containing protein [Euzebyales bacterium]
RRDGAIWLFTALTTIVVGVEQGIAAGVAASLVVFVLRTGRPHIAELGRVRGADIYRNRERYDTVLDPALVIVRVDGPLFFASSRHIETVVQDLLARRPDARALVMDMSAIGDVDATGAHALSVLDRALAGAGVDLHLTTVRGPVHDALGRAGQAAALSGRIHPDIAAALAALDVTGPLANPRAGEPATALERLR